MRMLQTKGCFLQVWITRNFTDNDILSYVFPGHPYLKVTITATLNFDTLLNNSSLQLQAVRGCPLP